MGVSGEYHEWRPYRAVPVAIRAGTMNRYPIGHRSGNAFPVLAWFSQLLPQLTAAVLARP